MASRPKPVNWSDIEELANELAAWLQITLRMKKRPDSIGELGPWPKDLSERVVAKVNAAAVGHLMLTDFLARRVRSRIRDLENLLEALRAGSRWAESLKSKIAAFAVRERQRGALAAPLRGVVDAQEAGIARLERFQKAFVVGIARLEVGVAQGNNAVRYPATVRGQNALVCDLQRLLKAAGFKPRELPKVLRQRRY